MLLLKPFISFALGFYVGLAAAEKAALERSKSELKEKQSV
jgi:hypothetical protein|tara:strand:+ start:116 stop:235 length:120 start_codon:yes stop_codon:yes gene_type:complete